MYADTLAYTHSLIMFQSGKTYPLRRRIQTGLHGTTPPA